MLKNFGTLLFDLDISKIPNPELPPPAEDGRIPLYNGDSEAHQSPTLYPKNLLNFPQSQNIQF